MRRRGHGRALRGLAAGVLTSFLALLFHVLGGGAAPGPLALAVTAAAVTWAAMLIGRARPSLPLLVLAVAVGQVVLHTAFSITTGHAVLGGPGGHAHGGLVLGDAHGGRAMWLAHVLAGVVTVLAVRHGEAVLRRLLELARLAAGAIVRVVLRALAAPGLAPASRCRAAERRPSAGAVVSAGIGSVVVRRGPPAFAA